MGGRRERKGGKFCRKGKKSGGILVNGKRGESCCRTEKTRRMSFKGRDRGRVSSRKGTGGTPAQGQESRGKYFEGQKRGAMFLE